MVLALLAAGSKHESAMSTKTVGEKLFLKKGMTLRVISAPKGFVETLGQPDATVLSARSKQAADVVVLFTANRAALEAGLDRARQLMAPGGAFWLAYPKGTSKAKSDINRDSIREYAASLGLDTVSLIAIDEVWSCLRLKPAP
jgi:hypothetical protein